MLSDQQIERYSRQIILPEVGGKGQEKLLRARVLVQAQGPLHTAALHYLAAAGVGTLGVFTDTNDDVLTALAASQEQERFCLFPRLNPDCSVVRHTVEEVDSPQQLVRDYDLVLSDSTSFHDACYANRRPFLYATVSDEEATLIAYRGYEPDAPCLHCTPIPQTVRAATSPLAEVAAFFVGAQVATEGLKHLLSLARVPITKRLHFHFPTFECREEIVEKSQQCSVCAQPPHF
jgi:molybdopterin/thiamine biosynthesis adenylyltransferase